MKKRETVYICDHCGKAEVEVKEFWFHYYIAVLPDGWTELGREHLCPKCSKLWRKVKEEVDNE